MGGWVTSGREDCLKYALKRRLPLVLGGIVLLSLLAGCKLRDSSAIVQPTATKIAVEITLQNTRYGVSEPLGVLVKNTGSADVYALNGQAACTILQLQFYDTQKSGWVRIDLCRDSAQPQALVVHAGMSEPFTLAPGSSADPNAWATGSYRIALSYSAKPDGTSAPQVAYSQGFTITSS